jgi:hypothetical protein
MVSRASLISKAFGKTGALASIAEASTPVADRKLTADAMATGATGAPVSYANLAAFPASGNTAGDIGFATDTKSSYMWDGVAWQRISIGSQIGPRYTTPPPATHALNNDGTTATTITAAAVDESGFPITYDWDAYSGSTIYSASSLPPQLTSVTESNGAFSLVGSSNQSNQGTFVFRAKASDGVLFTPAITTVSLSFGYNVSNISYDNFSINVGYTSSETNPTCVAFNPAGTIMFVCGTNGRKVLQYTLNSAFSLDGLQTAYTPGTGVELELDISGQDTYPTGLIFNNTGTKMYLTGDTNNKTFVYTLPTPFSLASASYDNVSYNYSAAISPTQATHIAFNNNGTKLYISSDEVITQCSLSTAYDPSTFTTDSKSFDAGSQVDEAANLTFNNDGTKMFMGDYGDDTVHQYSLGTAFDISTTSYDNVTHTFTEDTGLRGLTFANNGSKLFMAGTQNNSIYQYSCE